MRQPTLLLRKAPVSSRRVLLKTDMCPRQVAVNRLDRPLPDGRSSHQSRERKRMGYRSLFLALGAILLHSLHVHGQGQGIVSFTSVGAPNNKKIYDCTGAPVSGTA